MESYNIIFKPSVEKDLRRLPHDIVGRAMKRIDTLITKPLGRGAIKLSGSKGLYRIRVGQYRIVYEVDSPSREIVIHYIRHRRDIYRAL